MGQSMSVVSQLGVRRMSTSSSRAESVECVVIGAGVVGLACARALAQAGKEVVILEAANHWGTETSARHSEVIHAGLYYPPGSLKAQLCVRGNRLLYEYCGHRGIPHRRISKLVVACSAAEVPALQALQQRAQACGVTDLIWLEGAEARRMEPQLTAAAAILSPSTGVLDSHTYMSALLADAESAGASLAVASRVQSGKVLSPDQAATDTHVSMLPSQEASPQQGSILLNVEDRQSGERMQLAARIVVNAAGLWAQQVSQGIQGIPPESIPRQYLARGTYFTLGTTTTTNPHHSTSKQETSRTNTGSPAADGSPRDNPGSGDTSASSDSLQAALPVGTGTEGMSPPLDQEATPSGTSPGAPLSGMQPFPASSSRPFSRLIYPLPQDGGLGVHLTLDLGGGVRFGPDVEWIDTIDYTVDPNRASAFYSAIRAYWSGLPDGALHPGYAGVRPKLSGPGQPAADFVIQGASGPQGHGVPGLVCLYGIESPGLTSSLAIAECVRDALMK